MHTRNAVLLARRDALIHKLPTRAPIFLPTDKLSLEKQVAGLEKVHGIYHRRLKSLYTGQLRALRNKYFGHERAFIIGNGPSLNTTDLSQLENEVTFCVNSFFLKMPEIYWTPTFYVVEDHLVAEDRADILNNLNGSTRLFPAYLGYCLDESDDTIFFNHQPRKSYPDGFDFSTNAAEVTYTGCTVTFTCMQLAHYMGFKRIYLIGVDADYAIPEDAQKATGYDTAMLDMASDDPNHFHPDYFGKGFRWHDPQVDKMLEAYQEARRVTDATGRPILNATIGGKLDVFERIAYSEIFPDAIPPSRLARLAREKKPSRRAAAVQRLVRERDSKIPCTARSQYPKLLVIDQIRIGRGTATGELKENLLEGWPQSRLLQVFANGMKTYGVQGGLIADADGETAFRYADDVLDIVHQFEPDAILYRPLEEKPEFHQLANNIIDQSGAPLAIWITDAWQDRLAFRNQTLGARAEDELRVLFDKSAAALSICPAMSEAYGERYGRAFNHFSNAIDPRHWRRLKAERSAGKDVLLLRYCGGLAEDMSLATVLNIAHAVESLGRSHKIKFEIHTRRHFMRLHGDLFSGFEHTKIYTGTKNMKNYRATLAGADINCIAYNFDELSRCYTRFSLANKLPECLASGRALLAIGPEDQPTISYLSQHKQGIVITKPGHDDIERVLEAVIEKKISLERLGEEGQGHAFENMTVSDVRKRFFHMVRQLARAEHRPKTPRPPARRKHLKGQNLDRNTVGGKALSALRKLGGFYAGRRIVPAILVVALFALPAFDFGPAMNAVTAFSPAAGSVMLLILIGNWLSQILNAIDD